MLFFELKSIGPKLVPFFETVTVYFTLFGDKTRPESPLCCIVKCLPIISLMFFVLLHGNSFSEFYSYSRKVLAGLVFSCIGDAFLVWRTAGYFIPGIVAFTVGQMMYAWAFGVRPFCSRLGIFMLTVAVVVYAYLYPGLSGVMTYLVFIYVFLNCYNVWRAVARVQFFDDLWTWTKLCACLGSLFFFTSDLILGVTLFRHPVPYQHPIVMITYYAAQLGITLSVVDCQVTALLGDTATSN